MRPKPFTRGKRLGDLRPPPLLRIILEALDAEMPLIVCITEGIPVSGHDARQAALERPAIRLIGPNCPV